MTDLKLLDRYKKCKSVVCRISELSKILEKHNIPESKKELILNDYMLNIIPPGTKGVIRGIEFNKIVERTIRDMCLCNRKFKICFEMECPILKTPERPDWFILSNKTNRVLIGMNQLDLWQGGQQLNRGIKYLMNNNANTSNSKLLCVVCNKIKFKNNKTKAFKLFEIGFANDTLCYLKNLPNLINKFFVLD